MLWGRRTIEPTHGSKADLRQQLEVARSVIDNLKGEISLLKSDLVLLDNDLKAMAQSHGTQVEAIAKTHAADVKALEAAHLRIEEILTRQVVYWQRTAESAIDRALWDASGMPLFRQGTAEAPAQAVAPEPGEAPTQAAQEEPDAEGPPRAHLLRNPRAFTRSTTLKSTIENNRKQIVSGIDEARRVMDEIDRQAKAKASQIPAAPQTAG